MDQKEAFLRDIIEHPDDDTPRLVYADWLSDHDTGPKHSDGDSARAAYIRKCCRVSAILKSRNYYDDPALQAEKSQLLGDIDKLLGAHGNDWAHELGSNVYYRPPEGDRPQPSYIVRFDRGFPNFIYRLAPDGAWLGLTQDEFQEHMGEWMKRAPITNVVLDGVTDVAAIAQNPVLATVRKLAIRGPGLQGGGIAALVESDKVSNITSLDVCNNRIDNAGAFAIARSPHLGKLENLMMGYNQVSDRGAAALAASTTLRSLTYLNMFTNHVEEAGIRAFMHGVLTRQLKLLHLGDNPGTHSQGWREMAAATRDKASPMYGFEAGGNDDYTRATLPAHPRIADIPSTLRKRT